jgi:hypothetical protein
MLSATFSLSVILKIVFILRLSVVMLNVVAVKEKGQKIFDKVLNEGSGLVKTFASLKKLIIINASIKAI